MKKLASLILALAMCLALGAPAFAGETSMGGNLSTELTSQLPTLKLTLPETATIILNPYRNEVPASAASATGIDKGDKLQVMNGVFSITSTTTSKVYVKAVVTASTGGNTEFSATAVPVKAAGHKLNLTLTHAQADGKNATVPVPDNVDMTKATNMKVISDSETTLEWIIPAAASSGDGATRRVDMQFGGTCSDSPTEEEGPWTESDTVSAAIVFTAAVVTDDPMVTMMYQATSNGATPPAITYVNLEIPTVKPADFSADAKITKIEVGNAGADLTDITADDTNINTDSGCKWDGTKITLLQGIIGAKLGATASGSTPKVVKVTMTYKNKAGGTSDLTYTAKVHVLAAKVATA